MYTKSIVVMCHRAYPYFEIMEMLQHSFGHPLLLRILAVQHRLWIINQNQLINHLHQH